MRRLPLLILACMIIGACACKRVPGYVVKPETMAQLMADMYVAEAMTEQNHSEYSSDSARQVIKQAVLAKYHVDQATFDTTMMWYGSNMDKYVEVCERTIEILEERNQAAGSVIVSNYLSMAGDSVDVWIGQRFGEITPKLPATALYFEMDSDENWQPGDIYTWSVKLIDPIDTKIQWNMIVNYSDTTFETLTQTTTSQGWNHIILPTDSTRTAVRLRGSARMTADDGRSFWIDSVELTRKRVNPDAYQQRYRLRHFTPLP